MYCNPTRYCLEDIDMNIPEAWADVDSSDALVGILDTGVYMEAQASPYNTELTDVYNSDLSRDFTGYGMNDTPGYHGTKVAGIVAGACYAGGSSFQGIVGWVSPSGWAPLVMYRIGAGSAEIEYALNALDFICNPDSVAYGKVRVVTCSWGAVDPGDTFSDAVANAYQEDIAIFAASGNDEIWSNWPYPAAYIDFTQAVAHVLCDSTRIEYLTGNYIDIATPGGRDIQTTEYDSGLYNCFGGTSAASPMAAGVASLMLGYCPDLTNDDVYEVMKCTAADIGPTGEDIYYGSGLIRADAAVQAIEAAEGTVALEYATSSAVTQVDSLTMAFKNIPNRVQNTSWARVYAVKGSVSLEAEAAKCVWARHKDCQTVRGPADLYLLGTGQGSIPYFNGKRLGTWAEVEQVSGLTYAVRGYAYHLFDDSSKQQDRGWFPFNPFTYSPDSLFVVAYLADESKKASPGDSPALERQGLRARLEGTQLELSLSLAEAIGIKLYDVTGRLAVDMGERRLSAGQHEFDFAPVLAANKRSSGVYFVLIHGEHGESFRGRVLLVR